MTLTQAILAVDPGKMSGLAFHDYETRRADFHEFEFDNTCAYVMEKAREYRERLLLVSESFIITINTAKNTQAPWSLELIGVMRYVSRTLTGRDLTLQQPAAAKRFSSNERLKLMGYWTPGLAGHAKDT
jgi:hypothetical protein